tara:strand:+ start:192 stop:608 length:417 start_codon:yes stop_codon:yes gene_type:complete
MLAIVKKTVLNKKGLIIGIVILVIYVINKLLNIPKDLETKNPLTDNQVTSYIDILKTAMGDEWTDYDSIIGVFEKIDSDGYFQIYNAWGTKKYINMLGGHSTDMPFFGESLNLTQWLNNECNESTKEKITELIDFTIF